MKGRKLLSAVIAGAMVLGTMSFPAFAENTDKSFIEVSDSAALKAAVNNIAENGTIKFTNEITVTKDGGYDPGVITFTKNCTVDLNGHTLNTGEMQWFAGSAAVTFTSGADNGKIKFGDVSDSLFRPDENGSFSIENITFTQTENAKVCYLFNMSGENSSINLKSCVLDNINTASYGGVICGNNRENTKASIENCQITNINGVAVFGGQVTVKNSTISATTPFKIARDNHYAVLSGETTIIGDNSPYNGKKIYTIGEDVTVDSQIPTTVPAATIGTTPYATLADAVAAAQDGDVIDLIGNTVQLNGQTTIDKDVTITNGTFNITGANCTTEGIIYIDNKIVEFNNVDFVGSNFTSAFGVIYANNNAKVTLDSCDFNLKDDMSALGGTLKGNNNSKFIVNKCTFDLENPSRVLTNITLDMSDTIIKAYVTDQTRKANHLNNHAFRNVYGEIKDSTIDVTGTETGLKNTDSGSLLITGKSNVSFTNTVDANIYLNDEKEILTVEPSANVIGDIVYGTVSESVLTDKITVNFVPTADENVYDIVLDGNYKEIYEFVGAELQFVNESKTLSNADMLYTIEAADDINVVEAAYGQFGFYIKDGATTNRITAHKIILGKVVFGQQGNIKFSIKQDGNNSVQTTQYRTHLEEEYKPNVVDGLELVINSEKSSINSTVEAATRDVLVKVDYAHELVGSWTDNKITVTLKNAFGETSDAMDISDGEEPFAKVPVGRITVTLKAPGFRTFTYTTTVEEGTDPLVLSFWNDTKRDTAQSPLKAIEAGKAPIANNFVVGDIAMDYIVDKYDLAAVTSYYGTYGLTDENKIKYDLNRDGSIDITDVAYVLHNFGF
jgi:hypothetical protein